MGGPLHSRLLLLGSWPISSRPEGAKQGPAFRVSFVKAEPDAELAGPSNSLPQPCRTLMKPPENLEPREWGPGWTQPWKRTCLGRLNLGHPKLEMLPHHSWPLPISGMTCPQTIQTLWRKARRWWRRLREARLRFPKDVCLPTPVFLLGEFHGQRSLAGPSPWGH